MKRPNLTNCVAYGVLFGATYSFNVWAFPEDGAELWVMTWILFFLAFCLHRAGVLNLGWVFDGVAKGRPSAAKSSCVAGWRRMKREMRVQHIADCRKDLVKLHGRKGFVASAIRGFTRSEIERAEAKLAAADARAANDKEND